jgi:ABC-2 type transport system permease protein
MIVLLLQWVVARVTEPPLNQFLAALALHHQNFIPFKQGILDLKRVVYYLVVTYFFLLAATKVMEARRWR